MIELNMTTEILGVIGAAIGGGLALASLIGGTVRAKKAKQESYENSLALLREQEKAQSRLNKENAQLGFQYGEEAADAAHQRSMSAYEIEKQDNSAEAQLADLKAAGLSTGLLYGGGGAGGAGASSTRAAQGSGAGAMGGQAPDYLEVEANKQMAKQAAAELTRTNQEAALLGAEVAQKRAETKKIQEETETSKELTPFQRELLREEATSKLIDNVRKDWENLGGRDTQGEKFGALEFTSKDLERVARVNGGSLFDKKGAAEIAKIQAETEGATALAQLNTEKKQGYWQELLNATTAAENDKIRAAAVKLAAEWETGEYTNWKTWAEQAQKAAGTIVKLIKP